MGGIAFLLPLNGQAKVFSNAIQQWFSAVIFGLTIKQSAPEQDASAAGQSAAGVPRNDNTPGREPAGGRANQNRAVAAGEAPAIAAVTIAGLTIPVPQDKGAVSPTGSAIAAVYIIATPDKLGAVCQFAQVSSRCRARLPSKNGKS